MTCLELRDPALLG